MNVLFVLNNFLDLPETNGTTRWFSNLIKPMRNIVDKIDVVEQAIGTELNYLRIKNYCDRLFLVKPIDHSKYRYKWLFGWDYAKIRAYNPDFIHLLKKLCEENYYDLIILVGHGSHVNIPYLKANHIMVATIDAPSGTSVDYSFKNIKHFIKLLLNRLVIKTSEKSYNSADSVLVVSEKDKHILLKDGITTRIIVIPIGVDINEFSPNITHSNKNQILFTGVLDFPPNVDASIHLVNDIYILGNFFEKGLGCCIAGRKPLQKIRNLKNIKGVQILEDLPDIRPVINDSLIYVAPMRTGFGMKNKILEAMSMEKTIVGYPLTFNGFKNPEEFAFVCNSSEEIILTINMLLKNEHLIHEMGRKARKIARDQYALEKNVEIILNQIGIRN